MEQHSTVKTHDMQYAEDVGLGTLCVAVFAAMIFNEETSNVVYVANRIL